MFLHLFLISAVGCWLFPHMVSYIRHIQPITINLFYNKKSFFQESDSAVLIGVRCRISVGDTQSNELTRGPTESAQHFRL
jgi:hypothetical protein